MHRSLEWMLIVLPAGGLICWLWVVLVSPARELLSVLRRIAAGDFRTVMLAGRSPFLRGAADDLRVVAETLSRQKTLLAEEEFSLAMILGSMTEGVVITGSDLRIRLANKAALAMFNLPGSVTGLLLPEVFMSHELLGVAQRAAATGEVKHGEFALGIPGLSQRCHLVVTAAALKAPERGAPDGLLLVLHDVTRLRELESVRREFVANVSHEFRTPLSVINGYLETLEQGDVGEGMLLKSVAVMQRHCTRLNRLIEDLLTISRMEEKGVLLETAPSDLGLILRDVVQQTERDISKRGVEVSLSLQEGLPRLELDVHRIEQAFSNLLANALRHGAQEGGRVAISADQEGSEVRISFSDNGPGIPLQDQRHLFERFYRVGGDRARQTGGTGLGLSIVKNVVQAHGGRITLESKPGEGSTFSIFLRVTR